MSASETKWENRLKKPSLESLFSALGGLIALASVLIPWYSTTVQAFGLGSSYASLLDEFTYWSTLPTSNPQAAAALDANAKLMMTGGVLLLVIVGGVLGFAGVKWRITSILGCICLAFGLGIFEFVLRPFGNQASGMVVNTTPSWGFFIAVLSALILLVAFFHKSRLSNPY